MGTSHQFVRSSPPTEVVAFFKSHPERIDERDSDGDGSTPLLTALQMKRSDVAHVLLELGASPHKADRFGMTPLMKCCQVQLEDMAEALLNYDVEVNARDSVDGLTALDWALLNHNFALVDLLRRHGGKANAVTERVV